MDINQPASILVSSTISDVERDTGLAKETLRVWERRYDFPQPLRDPFGERVYPAEQVLKLRLVKRLIDLGFRPGKVIGHSSEELRALAECSAGPQAASHNGPDPALQGYLDVCASHQFEELRAQLSRALLGLGLKRFVIDVAAPLTGLVGAHWACGQLAVYAEHLYTETLQMLLRNAIFSLPQTALATPRILLTTLPQERHGLGLLMAEALCAAGGAHCISLGLQTPLQDIVEAARTQRADVVALSFSSVMNPRQALDGLTELRARLPAATGLWAGGACSVLSKRPPAFVQVLQLGQVDAVLADWRRRGAAGAVP